MTVEDSFTLAEMKDGLTGPARVKQLVEEMEKEKDHAVKNASEATRRWSTVASTIVATKDRDCLDLFIQLDGLWFIHRWLEDAQMLGDGTSDGFLEESIFALLRALEKLQLDNEKSVSSGIWATVKNLLGHRSNVVQDLARTIFYSWTQCVPGGGSPIITGASDDAVLEFPTEAEAVRCEIKSPADSPFHSSDLDLKASDALDLEAQNKLGGKDEKEDSDSSSSHVDDAEGVKFKVKNATDLKENKVLCDFDLNEDFSTAAMGLDLDLNRHSTDENEEGLLPIRQSPSHASSSLSMHPNIGLKWQSDVGPSLGIEEKRKQHGGVWEPPAEKRKRRGGVWEPHTIPLKLNPPTRESYVGVGQKVSQGLDLNLSRDSDDEDEGLLPIRQSSSHASSSSSMQPNIDLNCPPICGESLECLSLTGLNARPGYGFDDLVFVPGSSVPAPWEPSEAWPLNLRTGLPFGYDVDVGLGLGIGEKRKQHGDVWEPRVEKMKRQGGVWKSRTIPLKLDPPPWG